MIGTLWKDGYDDNERLFVVVRRSSSEACHTFKVHVALEVLSLNDGRSYHVYRSHMERVLLSIRAVDALVLREAF